MTDLTWMAEFSGWRVVNNGNIRSFSISNGVVFAVADNNGIYDKLIEGTSADAWTLRDQSNVNDISVVGDTMYAVKSDHKIYREPLKINAEWALFTPFRVLSVAVGPYDDMMYAISSGDGRVYKKALAKTLDDKWLQTMGITEFRYLSLAVQGHTIYAVGQDKRVYKQDVHKMSGSTAWQLASACCVKEIAAADGIIYAVAEDGHIYKQADLLMTPESDWIVSNVLAKFISITIRGDTIYGISTDQLMLEQRVGWMSKFSEWEVSSFEDGQYPSNRYLSIMAHNDIMYAVGKDNQVYAKFISKPIAYPPHLTAKGNTRWQALHWNLTDLEGPLGKRLVSTKNAEPAEANTSQTDNATANESIKNYTGEYLMSTPSTTQPQVMEAGIMNAYVDRYQDLTIKQSDTVVKQSSQNGTDSVGFKEMDAQIQSSAWQNAGVCLSLQVLLLVAGL
jgi:hypothetical protein